VTTTRLPRPFLTASWRDLVMLNYEVDPTLLRAKVPRGTELDDWRGRVFASVVGFRFLRTRVLGIPVPFHRDFEELNLRFYVRRREGAEVRRGVVFVRELVPRRAIAALARIVYNEPYRSTRMSSRIGGGALPSASYAWRLAGRWHRIGMTAASALALPAPGSLDAFISEHYWGYTAQRDGGTIEYRVVHPQWAVASGTDIRIDADFEELYGREMGRTLRYPSSSFIADGSEVAVHRPVRIETGPRGDWTDTGDAAQSNATSRE
jgi:uncharacterized protein